MPGHRLVTRVDVLERPRLDVVDPRTTVRGGGTLVEDPERVSGVLGQRALEDVGRLPARKDPFLELREADLRVHRLERGHRQPPPRRPDHRSRTRTHLVLSRGRGARRLPAVPPRLPPTSRSAAALRPPARPPAVTGGTRLC